VTIGQIKRADISETDLLRFDPGSIAATADIEAYFVGPRRHAHFSAVYL
jgi:hypothetical protein